MDGFAAVFEDLEDPRTGNAKRHKLLEILLIALGTLLSGGTTCADMTLFGRAKRDLIREFLALRHGIPLHRGFGAPMQLHVEPGVPAARPGAVPPLFPGLYATLRQDLAGHGGAGRQDAAPLLRPGSLGLPPCTS